jgi:hypothetical protein
MKKETVSHKVIAEYLIVVIEYEIKPRLDEDGVLSYRTIVEIFDKRQVIKGIKKMKHDFKNKRRKLLRDNNLEAYKKIVKLYKKAIESKLEDNLRLISRKVRILIVKVSSSIVKVKDRGNRVCLRKALHECRSHFRLRCQRLSQIPTS